ncbi:MAG: DegT/DnrJ/EryC1/StrS family aminotransferase [Rhodothermales bacterium]
MKIPITKVVLDEQEMQLIQEPLKTGWVVQGPFVQQFEEKFARFTGAQCAVTTSSCTTALHISLAALGVGPGDEVIVPAFTWVATANVAVYLGATPVFCDVDLDTFNLDPRRLEEKITPRTRAIIPVHLFGLAADMDAIMSLARKHQLQVVEDAACGFGAYYKDVHVGNFGDAGCFSFHPRKAITTGEGGMILTGDADLAILCRTLRDHGASRTDLARHTGKAGFLLSQYDHLGYNYRMTDVQGAMGVAQMDKAAWIQQRRTERARRYDALLAGVEGLTTPLVPDGCVHGYQSYVCLFQPEEPSLANVERLHHLRNTVMAELEEKGIATRQGTHAVTTLGYYREHFGIRAEEYPRALLADRLSLSLPLYAQMTDEEQDYVVDHLKAAMARMRVSARVS